MAILGEATFLNRLRSISVKSLLNGIFFGSDIPLEQIASLSRANHDVRIERIEHRFGHFVLAVESQFRTTLQTQTEDVHKSVWLVQVPLVAFGVTCKQQFWLLGRPVDTRHRAIEVCLLRKSEFPGQLSFFYLFVILSIVTILIFIDEELSCRRKFPAQSTFNITRCLFKELNKVFTLHNFLSLVFRKGFDVVFSELLAV